MPPLRPRVADTERKTAVSAVAYDRRDACLPLRYALAWPARSPLVGRSLGGVPGYFPQMHTCMRQLHSAGAEVLLVTVGPCTGDVQPARSGFGVTGTAGIWRALNVGLPSPQSQGASRSEESLR